jgi:glycosyltransferase involved in cell wall biosynthesis
VNDPGTAPRGRILILVENLPVPFDRRVWMQATSLARAGYQVAVICPAGSMSPGYERLEDVHIYRYHLTSRGGLVGHALEYGLALPMTLALTCAVYWRHGFDVIQSANPPDAFFLVAMLFRPFGVRFVFDHHDLVPEMCQTRWTGWRRALLSRLALWAERATYWCADRVIATNESYREVAVRRGGVAPERVAVVRSAPSAAAFRAVAARPELRNGRRFLVAYLGVMGPNDGLDHLLRAIAHIVQRRQRDDVQFTLIGSGDLHDEMVAMSRDLGLDAYVRFTGRVPDDEVIALLSSADVCVAPDPDDALNRVSSMNKIVEYMALGKAIVAFDLHETRTSADQAALYATPNDVVDFGDRILELLAAPDRRQAMGEFGRRRFDTALAWEHQRPVLLELYRDLLGSCRACRTTAAR